MGELFDFRDKKDFGFLTFDVCATKDEMLALVSDCKRIVEYAHDTVKNLCLIGKRLKELRNSRGFARAIDWNGEHFTFHRFDEFCEYAFGFSKTRTANFLALGYFVVLNDSNVDFIDRKYADYNLSQLIELSSVPKYDRKLFSPDMTVKDMRLVKGLLKTSYNSGWTPETALAEAKERAAKKAQEKTKSDVGITAPNVKTVVVEEKSTIGTDEDMELDFSSEESISAFLDTFEEWQEIEDDLRNYVSLFSFTKGRPVRIAVRLTNTLVLEPYHCDVRRDYYLQMNIGYRFYELSKDDLVKWLFKSAKFLFIK